MQRIFLHGGWRCGSTYLWNKFRAFSAVTAFYEPFSEKLARYTATHIVKDVPGLWESRHPPLNEPYWAEYLPLITGIGVPLYRDSFAVQRHFVARGEPLRERDYLNSLLEYAAGRTQHAVFGFSRSLGRVGAIKQHFQGYHVVLMRDPVQQWLSCRSYRIKFEQPYFELCHLLILALAPAGSLAARAARSLQLPTPPAGSFEQQIKFMRACFRHLDDELSYRAFLTVYILSYVHALPEADLTIDMDLLGDCACREAVAGDIATHTGLAADFSDYSLPLHDTNCAPVDFERIHDHVLAWLLTHDPQPDIGTSHYARTAAWRAVSEKMRNALYRVSTPKRSRQMSMAPQNGDAAFGTRLRRLFKSASY